MLLLLLQPKINVVVGVFCIPSICWNFIFCNVTTSNNFQFCVKFSILSHDNYVKIMWPCLGIKNTSPFGLKYLLHGWKCLKLLWKKQILSLQTKLAVKQYLLCGKEHSWTFSWALPLKISSSVTHFETSTYNHRLGSTLVFDNDPVRPPQRLDVWTFGSNVNIVRSLTCTDVNVSVICRNSKATLCRNEKPIYAIWRSTMCATCKRC